MRIDHSVVNIDKDDSDMFELFDNPFIVKLDINTYQAVVTIDRLVWSTMAMSYLTHNFFVFDNYTLLQITFGFEEAS